jgi:hypothetical protein
MGVRVRVPMVFMALVAPFVFASSASAIGFANCPSAGLPCVWAEVGGGEFSVGSTLVSPAFALEGGLNTSTNEFYEAEPGNTLTKVPVLFSGAYTETIELANESVHPPSMPLVNPEVEPNLENLLDEEGVALRLPVNIKIDGPSLNSTCIVGPIVLNLTTGKTSPALPNQPITGKVGEIEFQDGDELVILNHDTLVDNAFEEPEAVNCGSPGLNTLVNSMFGFPSPAGSNTAVFNDTFQLLA